MNKFLDQTVLYSKQNGSILTLLSLLTISTLFIAFGISLKSSEDYKSVEATRTGARLSLEREKLSLELEKAKFESSKRRIEEIESLKNEYELSNKQYRSEMIEIVSNYNIELRNEYDKFISDLKEGIEKEISAIKEQFVEPLSDEIENLSSLKNDILDDYSQFEKDRMAYLASIEYLKREIFPFLDEIQKDLQSIETTFINDSESELNANSMVLARIKLNAFLSEYREQLSQINLAKNQKLLELLDGLDLQGSKAGIKKLDPLLRKLEDSVDRTSLNTFRELEVPIQRPILLDSATNDSGFGIREFASIEGLAKSIDHGKVWVYPTSLGALGFAFSLLFGYALIRLETNEPNKSVLTTPEAAPICVNLR